MSRNISSHLTCTFNRFATRRSTYAITSPGGSIGLLSYSNNLTLTSLWIDVDKSASVPPAVVAGEKSRYAAFIRPGSHNGVGLFVCCWPIKTATKSDYPLVLTDEGEYVTLPAYRFTKPSCDRVADRMG